MTKMVIHSSISCRYCYLHNLTCLFFNIFSRSNPATESCSQFHHLVSLFRKDACSLLAAVAASAIKRYRLFFRKGFCCNLCVCVLKDVYIIVGSWDMSLSILICCADIQNCYSCVSDELCKFFNFYCFEFCGLRGLAEQTEE